MKEFEINRLQVWHSLGAKWLPKLPGYAQKSPASVVPKYSSQQNLFADQCTWINPGHRVLHGYFLFILPFVLVTSVLVNPVQAGNVRHSHSDLMPRQTGLEGYYQSDRDSSTYLHIQKKAGKLVLKQMWDGKEIVFYEKTPLTFNTQDNSFPLVFSKNASGEIAQLRAFDRDNWIKAKNYSPPPPQTAITLSPQQMQRYAGKYTMTDDGHEASLQFAVKGSAIEVTELWRNNTFTILPASETVFFGKGIVYPVVFSFDEKRNVTQALIFGHDVWEKSGN